MDRIVSFKEFASISGLAKKNISQLLWKSPHIMPPVIREPGRHPYFLESDINAWLEAKKAYRVTGEVGAVDVRQTQPVTQVKRGRGRPRKEMTIKFF